MLNVNILNELIKGIASQIPLVQSYYTTSPYECWNTKEVKYGSVSFVITRINTRESTTTYDATIYYADRALENASNRDSIHSDAATVIQTIVGALNTADNMLIVSYPVGITLFEQDFEDKLYGGYAQISISTKGMGECFDDEFEIPAIVGTSAYWTKDEIMELFPLRTQLATVAYTGAFDDLKGVPDLVTKEQYDDLVEGVTSANKELTEQINERLTTNAFETWKEQAEAKLDDSVSSQQFNNVINDIDAIRDALDSYVDETEYNNILETLKSLEDALNDKVSSQQYNGIINDIDAIRDALDSYVDETEYNNILERLNRIETSLNDKVSQAQFDNLTEAVIQSTSSLAGELENKLNVDYFDRWADNIESDLATRPTQQNFDTLRQDLTDQIDTINSDLSQKVSSGYFENWKTATEKSIDNKADKQTVNNLIEQVETTTARIDYELAGKLSTAYFENWVAENEQNHATQEQISALNEKIDTNTQNLVNELNTKVNDSEYVAFRDTTNAVLSDKVGRQEFDNLTEAVIQSTSSLASALENKLDDAYFEEWSNGIEAEVDNRVTRQAFDNFAANVYTKEQTYNKYEIDNKVDKMIADGEISLNNYYTKEEVDVLLDEVEVDMSDYYTKSEVYSKSETYSKPQVDYMFAEYYTKTEVDNIVGDINTILDNVLYEI